MTSKIEEMIVGLSDIDADAVSGGAVLGGSTVQAQNWDQVMMLGCCTQGCCGDEIEMI